MIKIPDQSRFPGTGDKGNGIPENFKTQEQWLNFIKTNGCGNCHQIGNYATRIIPAALGKFESSRDAWTFRLSVGPAGHDMVRFITQLMTPDGGQLNALADWTDRIEAGELPSRSPPRPVGIERNIVVTVRDWLDAKHYLHDLTTTDRRNPTVNAYGPIYGDTELSSNAQPVLDPVHNTKTTIPPPVRDDTPSSALANEVVTPSPYFGMEQTWDSKVNAHTSAMDQDGRVYWAAQNRSPKDIPAYCKKGSPLRSAQLYPLDVPHEGFFQNSRQVTVYDPKTQKFTTIDTCFGTHHLNFAEDADNTLWLSNNTGLGGAPVPELAVAGWINTKLFWETGDAAKAQGWTPLIVDTNGNGKRDEGYNEPGQPPDYSKDTRLPYGMYAMAYSPADKMIWGSSLAHPGYIIRLDPGANPPDTALAEIYKVPLPGFRHPRHGCRPQRRRLAAARQRPPRQLRPPQMQGAAQRTGRREGREMPRGLFILCAAGAGLPGRSRRRGEPVLRLGRPAQHPGARRQCAVRDRQPVGFAARAGRRPDRRIARALSDGLFRQGPRRPHRRPERRLEGARLMGDLGQPHAAVHIEGIDAPAPGAPGATPADIVEPARRRIPAPPRPARALNPLALCVLRDDCFRGRLRTRYFLNTIIDLPHAEEHPKGARLEARTTARYSPLFLIWAVRPACSPGAPAASSSRPVFARPSGPRF